MHPSSKRGNNPELWNKLLDILDDKLQLGLLDHLKRIASYHFEDSTLTVQPENAKDLEYLSRAAVKQQLEVYTGEAGNFTKVVIKNPEK